jgi:hypothetical protein
MIEADKQLIQSQLKQSSLQVREKELNFFTQNFEVSIVFQKVTFLHHVMACRILVRNQPYSQALRLVRSTMELETKRTI